VPYQSLDLSDGQFYVRNIKLAACRNEPGKPPIVNRWTGRFVSEQKIVRGGIQHGANPKQCRKSRLARATDIVPVPALRETSTAGHLGIG